MTLIDEINEWDSDLSRPFYSHSFNSIYEILDYKQKNFFKQFSPTSGHSYPAFWDRLESWLGNASNDNNKKALFEFTLNIHFITGEDIQHLFLSAFSGPIKRWIIDLYNIVLDQHVDEKLNLQLHNSHTWYCSVTDMAISISQFYKVNRIEGIDIRPDLNTLATLGNEKDIQAYISKNDFNQIVLLEDFVGSGSQVVNILKKCSTYFKDIPILFVPLIICSNGLKDISDALACDNWRIDPLIEIGEDDLLDLRTDLSNKPLEREIVKIAENFSCGKTMPVNVDPVYGFGKTGALIVLHSNTPNNTMPFIWWTDNWNALFPRSTRT